MAQKRVRAFLATEIEDGKAGAAADIRQLIVRMVKENPTWGQERIAAELWLKLGVEVSPRTVRAYWPEECDPRNGKKTSSHSVGRHLYGIMLKQS